MRPTWWPRTRHHHGRDRGFVEAGIAAGGALLVVGAVVGNGVAATVVDMSDGHTWLPGEDGRIVQVNPATGQPERRLVVAGEESDLSISQRDGNLIVTDLVTGDLTAVDLTALVASGNRAGSADDLVLVGGGQVVLVDTDPGTVRAVDPLTLADLGSPYRTETIADAVIDDEGDVWVLTENGDLTQLSYDTTAAQFHTGTERAVTGAGSESRLVPHEKGVTVFAADGGAVAQVGAGANLAVTVPDLSGTVAAAPHAPADLVPASAQDDGVLFLLADRDLLQVDVGALGCTQPGHPVVFNQKVYLPCLGMGRIMVLDAAGQRAGADIVVPGGGDPQLTLDEGRLFITSQQDGRAVVVQEDGSTAVVDLAGAEVPEQAVDRQPTVNVPPPGAPNIAPVNVPPASTPPVSAPPVTHPHSDSRTTASDRRSPQNADPADRNGRNDRDRSGSPDERTGDRGSQNPGDDPRQSGSDARPDGADASDRSSGDPGDTADATGSADGTADSGADADGTGDADGGADDAEGSSDATADDDPSQPQNVTASLQADGSVRVTWSAPSTAPQQYVVASSDGATPQTVAGTASSATLAGLACGRTLTVTVTAHYAGGQSAAANTTVTTADCAADPADPADLRPTGVRAADSDGNARVSWTTPTITPSQIVVTASPGGASRTVAGAATSATLTGLTCGQDYTITVTAQHAAENDGSATTKVTMADCSVDPADLRPTGVDADGTADGDAQVTWTTPAITPDRVVVSASPSGVSQSVSGTATSATLVGLSCGQRYTITVTAEHNGEDDGAASASVAMPDCPAAPEATAATNVRATASGSTIIVSWNAASSGADEYQVRAEGGSWYSAGTRTSQDFPGMGVGSYTFQVRTVLGSSQADATSNQVTVAGAPGAPGRPSVTIATSDRSQVTFQTSWDPAAANGSSITGYAVSWSGGGVSGSTTVSGASTGSIPISCSGQSLCTNGGTLTVTVTATNGVGTGPAASGSATVPTPPPPPPVDGDPVLSESSSVDEQTGQITASITYHPISTWANFTGTCTANVGGETRVISCSSPTTIWAGSAHLTRGLYAWASVTASGGGVSATSSTSVNVPGQGWCNPNTGICQDPVSLDPSDPDVEITPAPWTPPEVPNPPVLVAGAFLLGTAGLLRTTRRTVRSATPDLSDPITTLTLVGDHPAGQNGDQPR